MKITRYEEKSDSLFICINSEIKPVCIEHFFTEEEKATEAAIIDTIERLVARLEIKEEDYIVPEKYVDKINVCLAFVLDPVKIKDKKDKMKSK